MTATAPLVRDEAGDIVDRLRHVLAHLELDCECQASLSGALDRFANFERRRLSRGRLAQARDHKDRIAAVLRLLSELDEISEGERDRTVFNEMALLFADIAESATAAAAALERLSAET